MDYQFSSVVNFLDRKLQQTSVRLTEAPCYFYLGRESKLEVIVFSNPRIGTVDVRLMNSKDDSKEPFFQNSYELKGLSMAVFEKEIEELMDKANQPKSK